MGMRKEATPASLPKQVNTPVDLTTYQVLAALQRELGLPTLAATLQKVLGDYWWGRSSLANGHSSWPTE